MLHLHCLFVDSPFSCKYVEAHNLPNVDRINSKIMKWEKGGRKWKVEIILEYIIVEFYI